MLPIEEVNRKLIHLIALLMPIGIFYIPKITGLSLWVPPIILAILFMLSAIVEWSRFKYPKVQDLYHKCFHASLRKNEDKKITGATYIIGGAMISAIVFVNAPHISFTVLTLFILGDAIAALIGMGIGRITFLRKTLEGSMACFGLCVFLFMFIFPHLPFLMEDWGIPFSWPFIITISLLITLFELIPIKITRNLILNDNLYVPVMTGLIVQALLPLF
jgi:dolichol kinase